MFFLRMTQMKKTPPLKWQNGGGLASAHPHFLCVGKKKRLTSVFKPFYFGAEL